MFLLILLYREYVGHTSLSIGLSSLRHPFINGEQSSSSSTPAPTPTTTSASISAPTSVSTSVSTSALASALTSAPTSAPTPESTPEPTESPVGGEPGPLQPSPGSHPIERLVLEAETAFEKLVSTRASDLKSAAAAYRSRRGRHPPPGFDAWFDYAQNHDSLVIEEFFDQIYHDINPLWALPPDQMRRDVRASEDLVRVRKGKTKKVGEFWRMGVWSDMIGHIARYLPDMDIAFNSKDEPRLSVEWEEMARYVQKEAEGRKIIDAAEVVSEYSGGCLLSLQAGIGVMLTYLRLDAGIIKGEDDATPPEAFNWTSTGLSSPPRKLLKVPQYLQLTFASA
ncbi:hypothetical protein GP486_007022 [Trichoglossum hirsutum]|uniref:Uncharacterized protein n=1 Tax=Trichoglossum hirsutum TaxID=265104 RepID=A0A9P8L735_9PEZI|nr:hypothetical protein GP486_007022 [Trichoglossum hirsutum]